MTAMTRTPGKDGDVGASEPGDRPSFWIALLVAGAFFMENLDSTVIATAMPAMAGSFGILPIDLNIGMSAYVLTLGVFIPISGWMADRFGARTVFASAISLFTLASFLCGHSQSLGEFVGVRILQGVGGAMMVPVGRLVVLNTTPKDRLIGAIATLTWPALVAPILGPPLGGFITTYAGWHWIFYLNIPLGFLALLAALALIPQDPGRERRPFDWTGFVLCGSAIICLMYGAELAAAITVVWTKVATFLAIGAIVFALALKHLRRASHPMMSFSAMRQPTFAVTIRGGTLLRMAIHSVPFLLPLMFQVGFGFDPVHSGFLVIAVFAGNLAMKPATTPILRRFGFKPVLIANGIVNASSFLACAFISATTPVVLIVAILFIGGLTRSMQFTAVNTIAFADISKAERSGANTLFATASQLSAGMGIAFGAIAIRVSHAVLAAGGIGAAPAADFRFAFVIVALVAALGVLDSFRLDRWAGHQVSGRRG
jgi:EmrB/QacA subfamily drug resistance transporter